MNNPFSQPKLMYKIRFITNYRSIELFEKFFPEDVLGTSAYEVESSTIDAMPDDLWSFEVYVAEKPKQDFAKELTKFAHENEIETPKNIEIEEVVDKDWVAEYQKQLKPIEIGRFFITSTNHKDASPADKTPIFLEASRAFGTGDHATTSLCIEAMEILKARQFNNIFDVGTGSGILSFAAEKIWPDAKILACDIEEISVQIADDNKKFNNSHIYFYQNIETDLEIPDDWKKPFDLIVSNILQKPLIYLAETFRNITSDDSNIILSGFLDYQKDEVANAYVKQGFKVEEILEQDKWITLILKG